MLSVHYKLFPIKIIASDSIALIHKNQPFHSPKSSSRNIRTQFFVNLSTLVKTADPSTTTVKKRRKSGIKNVENKNSYTVSYLMNSCGFAQEKAVSVSSKVSFETPEKPDCIIALLRNYGFSTAQIANIVRKRPQLLLSKEKTLLPKLQFFESIGVSKDVLTRTIARDPTLLTRSLENQIIPNYNFLKSLGLTNERVASAMKRTTWVFLEDLEKKLAPNIAVLRELKVPESCIILLMTHYPEAIMLRPDEFSESVSKVLDLGFNPLRSVFVLALHALSGNANRTIWDRSFETYSNWGWSREDIYGAFRRHPNCMILSHKKISNTMEFLVNKMGWDPQLIVVCPGVLFFNLENRIVPRCSVVRVLLSRNLLAKEVKLSTVLLPLERYFLKKFVTKYENEVPKLYDFYLGKIGVEEL